MRVEQEHWYYTTNELWQFHSFDDGPAIDIESYENITKEWEEEIIEQIDWYKARYKNGELHRDNLPAVIRGDWTEYFYIDWIEQNGS
jgi:hypothetical protein